MKFKTFNNEIIKIKSENSLLQKELDEMNR